MEIHSPEELQVLDNGNQFSGTLPEMKDSTIHFNGSNNLFYCEPGVVLYRSNLTFNGSNSIIILGKSEHDYKLNVTLHNESVCFFGRDSYFNGTVSIMLSEGKHFFIGNGCLFSFGIWIRTADPHLIYDCATKKRVNPSKSVYIGDHVWVGQAAMLLKGTEIDSGAIIGAMALVAGKHIPHNSTWGGNPAKMLRDGVAWDGSCVHAWTDKMEKISQNYNELVSFLSNQTFVDPFYRYEPDKSVPYDFLESLFSRSNVKQKLNYLLTVLNDNTHNRFVHSK